MGANGILRRVGLFLFLLGVATLPLRAQFGAVDATFRPDVNGASKTVRAMATQSDKKIVVVGDFASIDTKICKGIARYNTDGTLDMDFAKELPGTEGPVYCVAIQSDGKILIGGDFTAVHGTPMNRVARLNKDGTLDTSFSIGTGVNGPVYAIAQSSYFYPIGLLIGGDFTAVNGTPRKNLALIDNAGSVNAYYFSGVSMNGAVRSICPSSTSSYYSSLYIGGEFTQINGVTRNRLARLSTNNTLDSSFNSGETAGPDGPVYSLAVSSTFLFVGGDFNTFDGKICSKIAAIDSSTGKVPAGFALASADGAVRSIQVNEKTAGTTSTVSLYLGGDFTLINGVAKGHVALMNGSGSTNSFPSSNFSWYLDLVYAPQVNGAIYALANESDDKLILGGAFTGVGAVTQASLARLYGAAGMALPRTPVQPLAGAGTDTQLVLNWSGVGDTSGYIIERSPDGVNNWTVLIKGSPTFPFIDAGLSPGSAYYYRVTAYSTNGTGASSPVASAKTLPAPWTQAGALDVAFAGKTGTGASGTDYCVVLQPDGRILVGGNFSTFNGVACKNIVRLLSDGAIDPTFNLTTGPNSTVQAIAVQSDGKILIGGYFSQVGSVARNRLARLNADGTLDTAFIVPASGFEYGVAGIAVQSDGKAVVIGDFNTVGGAAHAGIVRLNVDGALDSTFNAQLSFSDGYCVAIQPDGKIVAAGFFQSANGVARGNIARFNADGSLDVTFASGKGADVWVYALQVCGDGKILIGGAFSHYDGVARKGVARLNADGSLDTTFDLGNGVDTVNALTVSADGKILIGGSFVIAADKVRMRIARLNAGGSVDESFQPGIGADSGVKTLALQPDGKCLVGGYFTTMNGATVNGIARLLADNGTSAPVAPVAVTAAPVSSTSVQLSWGTAAYSSGYQVYQSEDGLSNWTLVNTVPGGTNSFTVTGLPVGMPRYFRVRAFSTNGEAPDSVSFFASTYTQYQQWKVDHLLSPSAPDVDDAIGKGVPHLLDYAFGGDPQAYDGPSILPSVEIPGNQMQITFWCDATRTDLTYTVQVSDDLKTWTDIAQSTGGGAASAVNGLGIVTDPVTGRRQVTVTDPAAIGATDRRYLRVKVSGR